MSRRPSTRSTRGRSPPSTRADEENEDLMRREEIQRSDSEHSRTSRSISTDRKLERLSQDFDAKLDAQNAKLEAQNTKLDALIALIKSSQQSSNTRERSEYSKDTRDELQPRHTGGSAEHEKSPRQEQDERSLGASRGVETHPPSLSVKTPAAVVGSVHYVPGPWDLSNQHRAIYEANARRRTFTPQLPAILEHDPCMIISQNPLSEDSGDHELTTSCIPEEKVEEVHHVSRTFSQSSRPLTVSTKTACTKPSMSKERYQTRHTSQCRSGQAQPPLNECNVQSQGTSQGETDSSYARYLVDLYNSVFPNQSADFEDNSTHSIDASGQLRMHGKINTNNNKTKNTNNNNTNNDDSNNLFVTVNEQPTGTWVAVKFSFTISDNNDDTVCDSEFQNESQKDFEFQNESQLFYRQQLRCEHIVINSSGHCTSGQYFDGCPGPPVRTVVQTC